MDADYPRKWVIIARRFTEHINSTQRQVLRYPGRILPFIPAHPKRADVVNIVKNAVTTQGFVGVKCYPALGYSVDDDPLPELYTFCNTLDVPIIQHCSAGGFYASKENCDRCHPQHWKVLLDEYTNLRISFAHFGGEKDMTTQAGWAGTILNMMKQYKGRVYADIACHIYPMKDRQDEKAYYGCYHRVRSYDYFV